uniref:Putative cyclic amp-dependent transcription factor atf-6 alpha isoform x3 n=1 Tax=Ornithodoros turicata TaxID=34597 RepID=A0A2R5LFN2_9ACAR
MFSQEDYNFIFKELSEDGIYEALLQDLSPTDSLSFFDKHLPLDSISLPDSMSLPDVDDINIKMEPSSPGSSTQSSCSFPDPDLFLNDVSTVEQAYANDGAASGGEGSVPETPPDTPPNEAGFSTPPHHFLDSPAVTVTVTTEPHEMVTSSAVPFTPVSLTPPLVSTVVNGGTGTTQGTVVDAGGTQTLMLTAEEFAQLTSRGVLTLKTSPVAPKPAPAVVPAATSLPVIRGARVPVVKATIKTEPITAPKAHKILLGSANALFQHADNKALKRQQRMIKNRESACLSRRKRKEYVQKLELQVRDLNNQNSRLREENMRLRHRVAQLEGESLAQKKVPVSGALKKTTALLAVVFMLSLNIAPISVMLSGGGQNAAGGVALPLQQHRMGRSLLWSQSDMPSDDSPYGPDIPSDSDLAASASEFLDGLHGPHVNASSKCPTYINQTESRRLETELRGFVLRVETESLRRKQQRKVRLPRPAKPSSLKPKLWAWAYRTVYATDWHAHRGQNFLQLYKASHRNYEEFYQAIDRRDDTFYFVSFSGDHLLLSAAPQNRTSRPKMSLVMPAMMLNESVGHSKDHVTLMQIDCEVTNTKMVYVKESVIPPHLREPPENRTQGADAPPSNTSESNVGPADASTLIKVPPRALRRRSARPPRGGGQ